MFSNESTVCCVRILNDQFLNAEIPVLFGLQARQLIISNNLVLADLETCPEVWVIIIISIHTYPPDEYA